MRPFLRHRRGFTLIELLVTMAIIIGIAVVFYYLGRGHAVHELLPGEGAPAGDRQLTGARRI